MHHYYTKEQEDAAKAAQAELLNLYAERLRIEDKMRELAPVAFPVGTVHTCTQWRYPVEVTVLECGYGYGDGLDIYVRSATGKEYRAPATSLGVDFGEALRLARG